MEYSRLFRVFVVAVVATWGAMALAGENTDRSSSSHNAKQNPSTSGAPAPGAGKGADEAAEEDCD